MFVAGLYQNPEVKIKYTLSHFDHYIRSKEMNKDGHWYVSTTTMFSYISEILYIRNVISMNSYCNMENQ